MTYYYKSSSCRVFTNLLRGLKGTGKAIPLFSNNHQAAPFGIIGVREIQTMVIRLVSALGSVQSGGCHHEPDGKEGPALMRTHKLVEIIHLDPVQIRPDPVELAITGSRYPLQQADQTAAGLYGLAVQPRIVPGKPV